MKVESLLNKQGSVRLVLWKTTSTECWQECCVA